MERIDNLAVANLFYFWRQLRGVRVRITSAVQAEEPERWRWEK